MVYENKKALIEYENRINNHPILDMCRKGEQISEKEELKFIVEVWDYEKKISTKAEEYADVLVITVREALEYVKKAKTEDEEQLKLFTHLFHRMFKQRIYTAKLNERPGGVTGVENSEFKAYRDLLRDLRKVHPRKSDDELKEILAQIKGVTVDYVNEVLRKGPIIVDPGTGRTGGKDDLIEWIIAKNKRRAGRENSGETEDFIEKAFKQLDPRANKDVIRGEITKCIAKNLKKMHRSFMTLDFHMEKKIVTEMLTKEIDLELVASEAEQPLDYCYIDRDILCEMLREYMLEEALKYCLCQEPTFLDVFSMDIEETYYCCPKCRRGGLKKQPQSMPYTYVCGTCKENEETKYTVMDLYCEKKGIEVKEGQKYIDFRMQGEAVNAFDELCRYYELIPEDKQRVVLNNGVAKKNKEIISMTLYQDQGIAAYYNINSKSVSRAWGNFKEKLAQLCKFDLSKEELPEGDELGE